MIYDNTYFDFNRYVLKDTNKNAISNVYKWDDEKKIASILLVNKDEKIIFSRYKVVEIEVFLPDAYLETKEGSKVVETYTFSKVVDRDESMTQEEQEKYETQKIFGDLLNKPFNGETK